MKKLLLASTALVATAGVAAADVAITGYAEIGIIGGDVYETPQFHTDIDVTFSMTGESDGGLSFGAKVDLDENGAFGNTTQGGETYFLAYEGWRLDMGDTDGAFDAVMQEVNVAGASIADDETAHAGFSGNGGNNEFEDESIGMGFDNRYDGQNARVSYSINDWAFHGSLQVDDTGELDPVWGLGVRYSGDVGGVTLGVGLGFEGAPEFGEVWGVSFDAAFAGGFVGAINYSEMSFDNDLNLQSDELSHLGIGLGYTMDAIAVGFNWGRYEADGDELTSGWGIAGTYDLGGGLAAHLAYGASSVDDDFAAAIGAPEDYDSYSFGLSMSF